MFNPMPLLYTDSGRVLSVLILIIVPLISACDSGGSSDENGGETPNVLVPLDQGNEWKADVTGHDYISTATARVNFENEIILTHDFGGDSIDRTLEVSQQSDGLLLESLSTDADLGGASDIIFLKFPAEDGESYQHVDGDGTTNQVSVSRTSISVSAGFYEDCLRYTIRYAESGNLRATATIKPGVGPVRWEGKFAVQESTWELSATNVEE